MNLFLRAFKLLQATAYHLLSKFENPIRLTEQAIRDLKQDFDETIQNFAKVKAISIGAKKELEAKKLQAKDYEQKAIMLLKKAKNGELEQTEADRLASEALNRKNELLKEVQKINAEVKSYDETLKKIENKITELKHQIQKWEGEYRSLKARHTVAKTTTKVNKQLSSINYDSTASLLEEMKNKIAEEENLALAYENTAQIGTNIDNEIEKALGTNYKVQGELDSLKQGLIECKDENSAQNEIEQLKKELDS